MLVVSNQLYMTEEEKEQKVRPKYDEIAQSQFNVAENILMERTKNVKRK